MMSSHCRSLRLRLRAPSWESRLQCCGATMRRDLDASPGVPDRNFNEEAELNAPLDNCVPFEVFQWTPPLCVLRWTNNLACHGLRLLREPLQRRHWRSFWSLLARALAAVSWGAIAAGAVGAAALTLLLIAFGAGLGLSAVSPWSDSGVSASAFKTGTGIYLVIVAVMSSAVGGYLAGRLRSKWVGAHTHEVFFRDTAHGFIAWAFATLLSASALSSVTGYLANGAAVGVGVAASTAARSVNPADIYVDKLFRPGTAPQPASAPASSPAAGNPNPAAASGANSNQTRAEVLRLWTASFQGNEDLSTADKAYVAQVVAAGTGMSQADAEKRINEAMTEAKTAADTARKGAAKLSFWLTAAMLFGAFAASLAAVEGGVLRDGTWNDRVLTPRLI